MLGLSSPSEIGKVPVNDTGRELNWKQPKGKARQGSDCSSVDLQENQRQQETWWTHVRIKPNNLQKAGRNCDFGETLPQSQWHIRRRETGKVIGGVGEGRSGFRRRDNGLTMPSLKRRACEENCFPGLLLPIFALPSLAFALLGKTGKPGEGKDQVTSPCCFSGCIDIVDIGKCQLWAQRSWERVTCPAVGPAESLWPGLCKEQLWQPWAQVSVVSVSCSSAGAQPTLLFICSFSPWLFDTYHLPASLVWLIKLFKQLEDIRS